MVPCSQPPCTRLRLPNDVSHDISVVIVSFNTRELTMECVRSVIDYSGDLSVEIIVVDNQSSDGSSAALRQAYPDITVIDSPANGGFAYGNAIGFEQAHGRYVLLLNPDTRLHAGGLQRSLAFMEAHPEVGIMGPRVLLPDGAQQSSMIRFLSLTQLLFNLFIPIHWHEKTSWFGNRRYADRPSDERHDVDAVLGCFMFARRQMIETVGGLDTRFFMYGEETEWCHRAGWAGWTVTYNPEVEILHHGAASTSHMSAWKAVEMTRGHLLFLCFTRGVSTARAGLMLMIARDLIRLPVHGLSTTIRGFAPSPSTRGWWARLKFEFRALFRLPQGQVVDLPDPASFRK